MTGLHFDVIDARAERFSAVPVVRLRVRVRAPGEHVDALILRVRVQIEPSRRAYDVDEEPPLEELFGARERWAHAVRPLPWTETAVTVNAFTDEATFDVPLTCTYDLDVASGKYLTALRNGDIPICLLFNGMIFRSTQTGLLAEMLPWTCECEARVSHDVWQEAMDRIFPGQAWIRVDRRTFDALRAYRAEHALYSWNDAFSQLLAAHEEQPT